MSNPSNQGSAACQPPAAFQNALNQMGLPTEMLRSLETVYLPLAAWVARQKPAGRALIVGINGAQGAGKSTLCQLLKLALTEAHGLRVASFSLDDIYLTRAERLRLSETVHPLLATRGVPGTHDIALGLATLQAL